MGRHPIKSDVGCRYIMYPHVGATHAQGGGGEPIKWWVVPIVGHVWSVYNF
jgi:hypothetical protein